MSKRTVKDKILELLQKRVPYDVITKMAKAHKNYVYVVASRNGFKKGRRNLQEQIVKYCEKNGVEATIKKFETTKERISTYKNRVKLKMKNKVKTILYFSEARQNFYRATGPLVEVLFCDEWRKTSLKLDDMVHFDLVDLGEF